MNDKFRKYKTSTHELVELSLLPMGDTNFELTVRFPPSVFFLKFIMSVGDAVDSLAACCLFF